MFIAGYYDGEVKISNIKSKIKFELKNSVLISKLIDGKFLITFK